LYRKFTALTSCEREENRWPQAEDRTCHQREQKRERSISNNVVNNLQFILFYNIAKKRIIWKFSLYAKKKKNKKKYEMSASIKSIKFEFFLNGELVKMSTNWSLSDELMFRSLSLSFSITREWKSIANFFNTMKGFRNDVSV
jgi:hypothetical protein